MLRTSTARQDTSAAAMRLFDRQGYHGTGLAEILQSSGAPRGSLYFHFPGGKEEIGVEAVNLAAGQVGDLIRRTARRHPQPPQLIRGLGRALARWLEGSSYQTGCAVLTITVETTNLSERLRSACSDAYIGWENALVKALAAGGLDTAAARRIAVLTMTSLEGALAVCRAQRSTRPVTTAANTLADLLDQKTS